MPEQQVFRSGPPGGGTEIFGHFVRSQVGAKGFVPYFWKKIFHQKNKNMKKRLSPADLAEPIVRLTLPDAEYDFRRQVRFADLGPDMTITWNATHTFGADGKPKDLDNDR
jgi:hypothetical protein